MEKQVTEFYAKFENAMNQKEGFNDLKTLL